MKRLLSIGVPTLALALFASCSAGAGQCNSIDSPLSSNLFIDGCASPVGFCTRGTVAAGKLAGTFEFTAVTSVQPDPNTPVMFYTGVVVYTTQKGTLSVTDSGVFNATNGAFVETQQVVDGTQAFGRSDGRLTSQGDGIFANVAGSTQLVGFSGSVAGRICRAHPAGTGDGRDGTDRSMALVDDESVDLGSPGE